MSNNKKNYVLALDVGTTTIRCVVTNKLTEAKASAFTKLHLTYPQKGFVEIDPKHLWDSIVSTINKAIQGAGIKLEEIAGIGVATQRASFITWKKDTGAYFHNFITWKDLRADKLVKQFNESFSMKGLRFILYCLYLISRSKRLLAASGLKCTNHQTSLRLAWAIKYIPELRQAIRDKNVLFGTMDTWLIYKLTKGNTYVTDITNACATGFFDPFLMDWSSFMCKLYDIPMDILPNIVNNDYNFGYMDKSILGSEIPIKCVMADQSSSLFGSCCFNYGDVKLTLGTGSFLNVNTGLEIHGSVNGMYPLVAWKFSDGEFAYMAEASANDTGSIIEWMVNSEIIEQPKEASLLAEKVEESDGVYFIPAFSGLGPPLQVSNVASGFIGITPTTKKSHMVRAVLESIIFRIFLLYELLMKERPFQYKKIKIDGGVSNNDFICRTLADMTNLQVKRTPSTEISIQGVIFAVGLKTGLWKKDDIQKLEQGHTFSPKSNDTRSKYYHELQRWLKAVDRFQNWS